MSQLEVRGIHRKVWAERTEGLPVLITYSPSARLTWSGWMDWTEDFTHGPPPVFCVDIWSDVGVHDDDDDDDDDRVKRCHPDT